jgi:hypothetical protein
MLNIFSELFFINVPDLDGQELYRERLCESHKHSTACRHFNKKGIDDLWSAILLLLRACLLKLQKHLSLKAYCAYPKLSSAQIQYPCVSYKETEVPE